MKDKSKRVAEKPDAVGTVLAISIDAAIFISMVALEIAAVVGFVVWCLAR